MSDRSRENFATSIGSAAATGHPSERPGALPFLDCCQPVVQLLVLTKGLSLYLPDLAGCFLPGFAAGFAAGFAEALAGGAAGFLAGCFFATAGTGFDLGAVGLLDFVAAGAAGAGF